MPVMSRVGHAVATTTRGARSAVGRSATGGWLVIRRGGALRARAAAGDTGMIRLFDLHAISYAGDALITLGLAGTIFVTAPLGEARTNVALYLLVTMVPFALLAPLIGPLLDHVRHGRRYALAATMLGRAMLAWLLADYLHNFGLYPAAFGVLALSRAYGVARAAAVPRLLPEQLGLSQANARAAVYGTIAGVVIVPLGIATFWFGPQWPLRVAAVIFMVGMVVALRLPSRADSDPPEEVRRLFQLIGPFPRRGTERAVTGRLVITALAGSAAGRAIYGFVLVFLAFTLKAGDLATRLAGAEIGQGTALGMIAGSLVVGSFLAVAVGARIRIHRPIVVQATGLLAVTVAAAAATAWFILPLVMLLCLVAAVSSGLAKISVDSAIQERIDDHLRASTFAKSETLLMLAWVGGSALGLAPISGRIGMGVAAGLIALTAARIVPVAIALRRDRLSGRPRVEPPARDHVDRGVRE